MSNTNDTVVGGVEIGEGGVKEAWPSHLPRPPSMKQLEVNEMEDDSIPMCVVFNANTVEGSTMVRVLSEKGLRVVAVVRVYTGKKTKELIKLKRVTVKVADMNDKPSLQKASEGCERAFFVTRYWERFDSAIEESHLRNAMEMTGAAGVKHFVMVTFEDTVALQKSNGKSQLVPDSSGRIRPTFEGMQEVADLARTLGISLSHMMSSYVEKEGEKKSLTLIKGPNGKVVVKSFFKDPLQASSEQ